MRAQSTPVPSKPQGEAAKQVMNLAKALAQNNQARKANFLDTMSKISDKGKPLSPRSQRLLGGLKGDQYKDIKAEHIPSERERQQAAAKAKMAAEKAEGSGGEQEVDDSDSPTSILRRAKSASMAAKKQMEEVNKILENSSKMLAAQFKGMSERKLKERIKISFDTFDTSKDGVLQVDEIQKALTGLGQPLTTEQATEFMRKHSSGEAKDGLTLHEFENVVRVMLFGDPEAISRVESGEDDEARRIIAEQQAAAV